MKILLVSYYNNNFGDDAMIEYVCNTFNNHDFYLLNSNRKKTLELDCQNLHILNCKEEKNIFYRIADFFHSIVYFPYLSAKKIIDNNQFDILLFLGGSIFIQTKGISWQKKFNYERYLFNSIEKKAIINCNFGPYFSSEFLNKYKDMFADANFITFRDNHSAKMFSSLNNVYCYPDILFNVKIKPESKKRIGISIINFKIGSIANNKQEYVDGINQLIETYADKYEVWLISFCKNEGDLDACNHIKENSTYNQKLHIYNHENVSSSLEFLSSFDKLICTRFHASVFAISLGIPFLPIVYSNKVHNMLVDIGYGGYEWNILDNKPLNILLAKNQLDVIPDVDKRKIECSTEHIKRINEIIK